MLQMNVIKKIPKQNILSFLYPKATKRPFEATLMHDTTLSNLYGGVPKPLSNSM
jgi:hypothetical protein